MPAVVPDTGQGQPAEGGEGVFQLAVEVDLPGGLGTRPGQSSLPGTRCGIHGPSDMHMKATRQAGDQFVDRTLPQHGAAVEEGHP